jgi:hypothetical protein
MWDIPKRENCTRCLYGSKAEGLAVYKNSAEKVTLRNRESYIRFHVLRTSADCFMLL